MYSNKINCEDQEVSNPHLSFKLTLKEMLRLWQNINSNSYGLTMDYQRQHENVGNEEVKWIFSTKKASSRLFLAMNFIHNAIDESVCLYFSHIFSPSVKFLFKELCSIVRSLLLWSSMFSNRTCVVFIIYTTHS